MEKTLNKDLFLNFDIYLKVIVEHNVHQIKFNYHTHEYYNMNLK